MTLHILENIPLKDNTHSKTRNYLDTFLHRRGWETSPTGGRSVNLFSESTIFTSSLKEL